MPTCPLALGAWPAAHNVFRTHLRWSVPSGARCKKGMPLASCLLHARELDPAREGQRCLCYAVLLAPDDGIVRYADPLRDWMTPSLPWRAEEIIAELDGAASEATQAVDLGIKLGELSHAAALGNDTTDIALHFDCTRMWWTSPSTSEPFASVIVAGRCEEASLFSGACGMYSYWTQRFAGPVQFVNLWYGLTHPSHSVLRAQLEATPEQRCAYLAELADWLPSFMAAMGPAIGLEEFEALSGLSKLVASSPFARSYPVLDWQGNLNAPQHRVIVLRLVPGDPNTCFLRNKRMGYTVAVPGFAMGALRSESHQLLRRYFERLVPSAQEIVDDLRWVVRRLQDGGHTTVLILNSVPALRGGFYDYSLIPSGTALPGAAAMELNAAAWELEQEAEVHIIDVEEIAMQLGRKRVFSDLVHWTTQFRGALQELIAHRLAECLRLSPRVET